MSTTSHHDTPQQKQRHQQPQQRRWQEQSNAESLHLKNRQHWTTRSSSSVVLQQHLEEEEALNLVANKDSENRFDSPNAMITSGKRAESFEGRVVGHGTQPLSEALDNSFQMATDAAGQNPQVFNNNAWLSLQTSQQIPSYSETMSSNMHATSPQNRHMEEDLSVSDLLNMEFGEDVSELEEELEQEEEEEEAEEEEEEAELEAEGFVEGTEPLENMDNFDMPITNSTEDDMDMDADLDAELEDEQGAEVEEEFAEDIDTGNESPKNETEGADEFVEDADIRGEEDNFELDSNTTVADVEAELEKEEIDAEAEDAKAEEDLEAEGFVEGTEPLGGDDEFEILIGPDGNSTLVPNDVDVGGDDDGIDNVANQPDNSTASPEETEPSDTETQLPIESGTPPPTDPIGVLQTPSPTEGTEPSDTETQTPTESGTPQPTDPIGLLQTPFPTAMPIDVVPPPVMEPTPAPAPPSTPALPTAEEYSGKLTLFHLHPMASFSSLALLPLLLICCWRRYCSKTDARGEYRAVAAQYGDINFDNTFSDTYSDDEDEDGFGNGDVEDSWGKSGRRTLEMSSIGKERNGGLSLEEMNG